MKGLGYGAGYRDPHHFEGNGVPEEYLPDALVNRRCDTPTDNGYEASIKTTLEAARDRTKGGT